MSKLEICNREFITDKNRLISGKDLTYLSSGNNGAVYRHSLPTGDEAVKVFFDGRKAQGLKYDTYKIMKDLKLQRHLGPQEVLYKPDYRKKKDIEGYTMPVLEKNIKANILYFPSSKVLESFSLIEGDAIECGQNSILMRDVFWHNTILTPNEEIWLCDVDWYERQRFHLPSKSRIIKLNKKSVNLLFLGLLISGVSSAEEFSFIEQSKLSNELREKNYQIYGFLEGIENTDKPIEYFKKRCR